MYSLYLVASITAFYVIYKNFQKLFSIRPDKFEDSIVMMNDAYVDFIDITYEDNTREFIEGEDEFDIILSKIKPIKYIVVNYSLDEKDYSILFNKDNILNLATMKFPFYSEVNKLPLYREVDNISLYVDDMEYDLTDLFVDYAGPKLNYHSDIVKIRFEEIVDHSGDFPELRGASGVINIDDNLGNKHIFKYPGEFSWNENILT